jgi:fucose 4-O-acetylase-like acetyltransferase
MLQGAGIGLISVVAATMISVAPAQEFREPEYGPWYCDGWNSYTIADCHRWGGGSYLLFDWASYSECYFSTAQVVLFVSPSYSHLAVDSFGSIPGDEYVNHLSTCLVQGSNP